MMRTGDRPLFFVNTRDERKQCYRERLENTLHDVEIILNHIDRLASKSDYSVISKAVINKELTASYCDLEVSMALMAVIIRKLNENQFIVLKQEERDDINALIHSNRFDYQNARVMVYSRLSKESVTLEHFLSLGRKIIAELD